jgi:hypothetical protein
VTFFFAISVVLSRYTFRMNINWHEPTPFSRMLGIILFVGVIPVLSFYIGTQYQDMQSTKTAMHVYEFPRLTVYPASAAAAVTRSATSSE